MGKMRRLMKGAIKRLPLVRGLVRKLRELRAVSDELRARLDDMGAVYGGRFEALEAESSGHRRQTAEIQLAVQEERALRQGQAGTVEDLKKQIGSLSAELSRQQKDFEAMMSEQREKLETRLKEQERAFSDWRSRETESRIKIQEELLKVRQDSYETARSLRDAVGRLEESSAKIQEAQKNILQQAERKMSDKINALPESKVRNSRHINKEALAGKIEDFEGTGINEEGGRDRKIIVNLTSFPERMYDIHYCLYSLLNQSCRPDMLVLWLAEEEFPGKEKDIPSKVLKLRRNGLTIKWCRNLHSYKKLIPALKAFPDDILVTADDDIFYPGNWLESLYESYLGNPEFIHCHRAHRIKLEDGRAAPYSAWEKCVADVFPSYLNFLTGVGGVLAVPGHFHQDMTEERLFRSLCPQGDDIWFWAMAVMNGTRVNVVKNPVNNITYINPEREFNLNGERTLFSQNKAGGNDKQLAAVLEHYPEIMEKLSRC